LGVLDGQRAVGVVDGERHLGAAQRRAPSPDEAVRWAADCRAAGLSVGCFRPPSVPDGISRLRLTARADLTDAQLGEAVRTVSRMAPNGASTAGSR
ncbi:8-amino-7-oxononanoate synthase, partial [Streptomyces kunmingensis]|nr:8-amino-7-oxononanoate synthase [Streptomyces kunmingensis]